MEKLTEGGLSGLFFLDENHGWAVGGNGVILKYTDGTWTMENSGTTMHLNDVFFTSEDNGWAAGYVRMHYTGNQWITIDTIGYGGITDVFFTDENNGWAGGPQKFYHYDTTGWHWYSLGFSEYYSVNSIFFSDSVHGWIGGSYSDDYKYIKTYNGISWSMGSHPQIISNALYFDTPTHGWSCGDIGYMQMSNMTIWEFAGGNWSGSYISYGTPNSLAVLDSADLYVATAYGHILQHDSLGWNLSNSLAEGKTELSFPDTSQGWAVGEGKEILHYSHGSWSIDTSFKTTLFEHIHFSDSLHGIASGRLADTTGLYAVYKYANGQWHFITDTIHIAVKSVCCMSSENGWAIAKSSNLASAILHYQNGQWTPELTTPFDRPINALSFSGPNSGWAVGSDLDHGITWYYNGEHWVGGPTTIAELVAVHHPDSTHAYAIGYHDVYTLVNNVWEKETLPVNQSLVSLCFPSPETCWVAGEYGGILCAHAAFPVGIPEASEYSGPGKLSVFPNPASTFLNITVEFSQQPMTKHSSSTHKIQAEQPLAVEIYDLFGQPVYSREIQQGTEKVVVDISAWPRGLYVVRLVNNKKIVESRKVVIK